MCPQIRQRLSGYFTNTVNAIKSLPVQGFRRFCGGFASGTVRIFYTFEQAASQTPGVDLRLSPRNSSISVLLPGKIIGWHGACNKNIESSEICSIQQFTRRKKIEEVRIHEDDIRYNFRSCFVFWRYLC